MVRLRFKDIYFAIISTIIITNIAVMLDVPVLRQVTAFIFLFFIPGFLILSCLRLLNIESTKVLVLSIGLSLSFALIYGIILNEFLLYLNYASPISTFSIIVLYDLAFLVLLTIMYALNKETVMFLNLQTDSVEKAMILIPLLCLFLSVVGMYLMNISGNNALIVILICLIALYLLVLCLLRDKVSERIYPSIILLMSLSLILLLPMRSNHLLGSDIHAEYYFFTSTLDNMHWKILKNALFDSCLSISLLPAIFCSVMKVPPEPFFKLFYPIIFSVTPVVVYLISKRYLTCFYSFLAACFFMFQRYFIFSEFNPRTDVAIAFCTFAFFILFEDKMNQMIKRFMLLVFLLSCVLSHYATTYIIFFMLFCYSILQEITSKKAGFNKAIGVAMPLILFAMIFLWYSQVTGVSFTKGVGYVKNTVNSLNKMFVEEMRRTSVNTLLGKNLPEKGLPHQIEFLFTWLSIGLIGAGIVFVIIRYRQTILPEKPGGLPEYMVKSFDVPFILITVVSSLLLVIVVLMPFVSTGYSLDRVYSLAITVLSVYSVIGSIEVSKALKMPPYAIFLLVMIPYLFCVTGLTYTLLGYERTVILSMGGEYQHDILYIYEQETAGARWIGLNGAEGKPVYSDWYGTNRLSSQARVNSSIYFRSLIEKKQKLAGEYIYLRYSSVVKGKLMDNTYVWHSLKDYYSVFDGKNLVYNNGGSEVWR